VVERPVFLHHWAATNDYPTRLAEIRDEAEFGGEENLISSPCDCPSN
jgi:hypothetical protein